MGIQDGTIIELENGKEYYVAGLIFDDEKTYLYLISLDAEKDMDITFALYEDDRVYPIDDDKLIKRLLYIVENKMKPEE